jgi:hypothetical protein
MSVKTVYSTKDSVEDVVSDLLGQLKGFEARALIFFASSYFDATISEKLSAAFGKATVFGCTTAGEIISGKMLKGSVVAMAIDKDTVGDLSVAVLENVKDRADVKPAFHEFENHFNGPLRKMDLAKYAGIVLVDGLSGKEEQIMDQIGDYTDLTFIGGSAGDDLKFQATHLYANGKVYTNAALLVLLHVRNGFEIIKTQSFNVLDKKLLVTKASTAGREVAEFNGKPAALAYAEAVGTTVLDAPNHFMHHPVGLMINGEPYVRSPQRLNGKSMVFYCNLPQGMEVSLLESTDIVKDTRKALAAAKNGNGPVVGLINFHCILRTLELEKKGQTEAYGQVFTDVPTIGFSTYGEEYLGHINQTATMLVLK